MVNLVISRFGFEGSIWILLLQFLVIAYFFILKFDDFKLKSALILTIQILTNILHFVLS